MCVGDGRVCVGDGRVCVWEMAECEKQFKNPSCAI